MFKLFSAVLFVAIVATTTSSNILEAGPFGLFGRNRGCASCSSNGSCSSNQAVVQPVVPPKPCCNCNCGCDLCKCKTECCANDKGCCDCKCGCPNCKCANNPVTTTGSCKDNSTCNSGTCGPNSSGCSSNYGYSYQTTKTIQTTQTMQTMQTNRQVYRRGNGPIRKIIKKIFHR